MNKKITSPEESVRQTLIYEMVEHFNYPPQMISIEHSLHALKHVQDKSVPNRRFDIICFAKDIHSEYSLYPLLLIECKAEKPSQRAMEQVLGYNYFVRSYFVAIAGPDEVRISQDGKEWIEGLFSYDALVREAKRIAS